MMADELKATPEPKGPTDEVDSGAEAGEQPVEVRGGDAEEENKWWIDRGPKKKETAKTEVGQKGIIERWAFELLKDYRQERALHNIVDINQRALAEFDAEGKRWGYISLGVGRFSPKRLNYIRDGLQIPRYAKALVIDAGYSVRFLITGDPPGEKVVDINFTEAPAMDYWVNNELIEERLFSSVDEAVRRVRHSLHRYLRKTSFTLTL